MKPVTLYKITKMATLCHLSYRLASWNLDTKCLIIYSITFIIHDRHQKMPEPLQLEFVDISRSTYIN